MLAGRGYRMLAGQRISRLDRGWGGYEILVE